MTFLVDLLIWGVRGGWTHKNARVLLLRGRFLFGFQNLLGACYANLRMYRSMRQIHREIILGKKRVETEKREHAEAFVMRCKAVAVDREPDRCGNSVWRP